MLGGKPFTAPLHVAKHSLNVLKRRMGGVGKMVATAAAGMVLLLGNIARFLIGGAETARAHVLKPKKSREVIEVKKSTVIALLVALAAVAGVLGALYVYVLRRERELDEYEQLLFSEDFNDDMLDDDGEEAEA